MSEYAAMLDKRREAVRSLVDDVVRGFIALSDADRHVVAARLDDHFKNLGHSKAARWTFTRIEIAD